VRTLTLAALPVWALFWVMTALPGVLYLLYVHRRKRTRIDTLLQTLQGLGLSEVYMRSRHRPEYSRWANGNNRDQRFREVVLEDFATSLRHWDFLFPVAVVTVLSAVGWGTTLSFTGSVLALGGTVKTIPAAFYWGFLGAYVANVGVLIDKFNHYELSPMLYHRTYQRLFVSTTAAYLLGQTLRDAFTPLVAFGIGLLPYQDLWNMLSKRASKAFGSPEVAATPPECDLSNIQGLGDPNVRQNLIELNISTVQALAMQDPIDLFFRTSYPLRTIVDWIDRAILYCYLGAKTKDLCARGINGAIEMGGLLELSEKTPVKIYHDGKADTEDLTKDLLELDMQKLYSQIAEAAGLKYEELLHLSYNLYYDPMVDTLYDLWGRN
jgi:hypothetical protein